MFDELERAIQILHDLISFDTTSRNSNLELISYLQDFSSEFTSFSHIDYNDDKSKANLLITIGDNSKEDGIILSGHSDVVPVDGQNWDSDPFTMIAKDNKLYGRGTSDMKGFLACCLALLPYFKEHTLSRPIYLVISYDEEVGCKGVPSMTKYIAKNLNKPKFAIIGEPTNMQVITAHKSIACFTTKITGFEAHSSLSDQGVSSIVIAGRLINFLHSEFESIKGNSDKRFIPPYSTFNIGSIQGGTAINIIPKQCLFDWEIRCLPQSDIDQLIEKFNDYASELIKEMQLVSKDCSITTNEWVRAPALNNDGSDAKNHIMQILGTNKTGCVSYATEAGLFQESGVDAIICGPGSIEQAHKENEYIETEQLAKCLEFLKSLVA